MSGIARGLVALLVLGASLASVGCWEKEDGPADAVVKADAPPQPTRDLAQAEAARERLFAAHHDRCVEVFVKAEGNGFERRPRLTHRQSIYPESVQLPPEAWLPSDSPEPAGSTWRMTKAELVSLLRHEKPGVYSADGKHVSGSRFRVRDLDEFEKASLAELRQGEQVLMTEDEEGVRLLGAIRARKDCLKCHSGKKEGDLLGALTYVFERQKP
jgi:hypothetical protein